jgi:hypothetical protein
LRKHQAPGINELLTVVIVSVSELKSSPATSQAVQARTAKFELR